MGTDKCVSLVGKFTRFGKYAMCFKDKRAAPALACSLTRVGTQEINTNTCGIVDSTAITFEDTDAGSDATGAVTSPLYLNRQHTTAFHIAQPSGAASWTSFEDIEAQVIKCAAEDTCNCATDSIDGSAYSATYEWVEVTGTAYADANFADTNPSTVTSGGVTAYGMAALCDSGSCLDWIVTSVSRAGFTIHTSDRASVTAAWGATGNPIPDIGICSGHSGTDEATCKTNEANADCVWDGGASTCSALCSSHNGNPSGCAGETTGQNNMGCACVGYNCETCTSTPTLNCETGPCKIKLVKEKVFHTAADSSVGLFGDIASNTNTWGSSKLQVAFTHTFVGSAGHYAVCARSLTVDDGGCDWASSSKAGNGADSFELIAAPNACGVLGGLDMLAKMPTSYDYTIYTPQAYKYTEVDFTSILWSDADVAAAFSGNTAIIRDINNNAWTGTAEHAFTLVRDDYVTVSAAGAAADANGLLSGGLATSCNSGGCTDWRVVSATRGDTTIAVTDKASLGIVWGSTGAGDGTTLNCEDSTGKTATVSSILSRAWASQVSVSDTATVCPDGYLCLIDTISGSATVTATGAAAGGLTTAGILTACGGATCASEQIGSVTRLGTTVTGASSAMTLAEVKAAWGNTGAVDTASDPDVLNCAQAGADCVLGFNTFATASASDIASKAWANMPLTGGATPLIADVVGVATVTADGAATTTGLTTAGLLTACDGSSCATKGIVSVTRDGTTVTGASSEMTLAEVQAAWGGQGAVSGTVLHAGSTNGGHLGNKIRE